MESEIILENYILNCPIWNTIKKYAFNSTSPATLEELQIVNGAIEIWMQAEEKDINRTALVCLIQQFGINLTTWALYTEAARIAQLATYMTQL